MLMHYFIQLCMPTIIIGMGFWPTDEELSVHMAFQIKPCDQTTPHQMTTTTIIAGLRVLVHIQHTKSICKVIKH